MSLTTNLNLALTATLLGTATNNAQPATQIAQALQLALTTGTGAGQADTVYESTQTITTGSSVSIDLSGNTSFKDDLGATLAMARVKGIFIYNRTTTAGYTITVGNGTNPFINWVGAAAHTVTVAPGGVLLLWAPDATAYAVTAATGDILKIANANAASVTVDVIVIGATA
jgi:hypothetical protein